MPRHDTITIPPRVWTQLTNADVSAVSFQVLGNNPVSIAATAGAVAPAAGPGGTESARVFWTGDHIPATVFLSDLWPGLAGANRLWAWAEGDGGKIAVSHA